MKLYSALVLIMCCHTVTITKPVMDALKMKNLKDIKPTTFSEVLLLNAEGFVNTCAELAM